MLEITLLEQILLELFAKGYTMKEIALRTGLEYQTIKNKFSTIHHKLKSNNIACSMVRAYQLGIISLER